MFDLGEQVGLFILSWIFWFIALYLFVYFFQRKVGKTLSTREKIFLVGKVSLLCTAANVILRLYQTIYG